ncbi:MAG: hypothetical protein HY314_16495 [Acidobacteria bacterium]|nr:hypothetical protein [Acidobacteriota bacterium]
MEKEERTNELQVHERKPYEKPMIIYRQPLEAKAAVCSPSPGKSDATCTVAFS